MKSYFVLFVLTVAFAAAFAQTAGTDSTAKTEATTASKSPTPTTSTNAPTTTSTATTTTLNPTTLTTTAKSTPTTTKIPTTSTAVPTTTTITPVKTSTAVPPTPTPTLPPTPAAHTFYDNSTGDKAVCVVVKIGARFTISYTGDDKKPYKFVSDLPKDSTTAQMCGNNKTTTEQSLTLTYAPFRLDLTFTKNSDGKKYNITKMVYTYNTAKFPNVTTGKQISETYNTSMFDTPNTKSYECNAEQTLNLTSVQMTIVNMRFEAFMDGFKDFSTAVQCPADVTTSNIVPIAVGAALAALVVIVLVAYLISRNRNQGGYESV